MAKILRLLLCWGMVWAAGRAWAGATSATWLDLPNGPRQAAFSGALGALTDDLDALGVNPAGLAYLSGTEISVLHDQWAQNLSVEHLGFGHGFGTSGVAIGGDYLNFGQVSLYDLSPLGTPVANGTFTPTGMDLYAGAGLEVAPGLSLGAGAKIIFQSLTDGVSSSAEAADLGVRYWNQPSGLSCGLALLNLGSALDGAGLPWELHLSGGYQVQVAIGHEFSIGLDGGLGLNDQDGYRVSAGVEYLYQGVVALRTGYRLASYGQLQGLPGLSAGLGVKLGPAQLDYAMTALGDLGMGHQVSLSYFFDPTIRRALPAPTGLVKGWEYGKMTLSWDEVKVIGVVGYNFYVKHAGEKDFKKVNAKPLEDNSVALAHVKKGATYHLGVTTVSRDGRESEMARLTLTP